ncbi:hypothetical protein [Spirochaeta cellobiosiphila]|uniref:hypothetical protein n=1 Tax=Spirochaeta cellobiosiphila TaxID=504483 RepID=UPI0003FE4D64|nr:hypothetical protein [Spirochaeta cellobiosiphila]
MEKKLLTLIMFFVPIIVFAQSSSDILDRISFDYDIKSLHNTDFQEDKWLVLIAGVYSVNLIDRNEDSYTVLVELYDGEWSGETVELYKCYVQFKGKEFLLNFPPRRSRTPTINEISTNDEVLVLCRFVGYDDENIPLLSGSLIKRIP